MSPDDWLIAGLISYEVVAAASQRSNRVPSLPLLTTLLNGHPRWVRWTFVGGLAALLIVHLELAP